METEYVKRPIAQQISQGDLIENLEHIKSIKADGNPEIILIPLAIVLTQACDLSTHFIDFQKPDDEKRDKLLPCVLICPTYSAKSFKEGKHLLHLGPNIWPCNGRLWDSITSNSHKRFHFLNGNRKLKVPNLVIDFKHYYAVPTEKVYELIEEDEDNYLCSLANLFKEEISQRFAYYLSRIALPDPSPAARS